MHVYCTVVRAGSDDTIKSNSILSTSDTEGTMTNTSATTVRNAPTPDVPEKVEMPTEPKKTTGSSGSSGKNGFIKPLNINEL